MTSESVLRLVNAVRGEDLPIATAITAKRWAVSVPNRGAPHFLQLVDPASGGIALLQACVEELDSWDGGFEATWCSGLGWLVELTPI